MTAEGGYIPEASGGGSGAGRKEVAASRVTSRLAGMVDVEDVSDLVVNGSRNKL